MENKPTVDKEAIDMTAQEWFEKGSMFTLDFLRPIERKTIYKIMDLYAHGKVRFHAANLLKERDELEKQIGEWNKYNNRQEIKISQLQSSNEAKEKECEYWKREVAELQQKIEVAKHNEQLMRDYPVQDEMWASRRWNNEHTDYVDLSGY